MTISDNFNDKKAWIPAFTGAAVRITSLLILALVFQANISEAAKKKAKSTPTAGPIQTSLIVNANNGKILHAQNANAKIYPASLTKVATLYMLFEALDKGKVTLDTQLSVSKHATTPIPLKLYLKAGEKITVRDAILGIIVKSANDASIVVAENLAGTETKFAKLMTAKAKQLGMNNTVFANSHGLHHPTQVTTAVDLAKLSLAIKRDFPQYYHYFSKTSFTFRGKQVNGHNRITANYPGAEGMKTGFTNPAGCCLITTATRNGKSLVGIVTGSKRAAIRDRKMASLLDEHFGVKQDTIKTQKSTKPAKSKNKVKIASNKR